MKHAGLVEKCARVACERFCCGGGCAYREDGRKPECDAVCGNSDWTARMTNAVGFAFREAFEALKEPTPEMVREGWEVEELQTPDRIWGVMLSASPLNPER